MCNVSPPVALEWEQHPLQAHLQELFQLPGLLVLMVQHQLMIYRTHTTLK